MSKISISEQELKEILALPLREFQIGDRVCRGKYDEKAERFYLLNDDDSLSGKIAVVKNASNDKDGRTENVSTAEPPNSPLALADTEENNADDGDDRNGAPMTPDSELRTEKAKSRRRTRAVILAAAALSCIVIACFSIRSVINEARTDMALRPVEDTAAVTPSAVSTDNGEDEEPDFKANDEANAALDQIEVIQVLTDLIPGDVITLDNIQAASISAETYNQITLGGTNIYQWNRSDSLMSKYVTTYIPAGQYLAYSHISNVKNTVLNPWIENADGIAYVTIPLSAEMIEEDILNFGTVAHLSIQKQTISETQSASNSDDGEPAYVEGLDHQTSVEQSFIVDTYQLYDVTVCDVLNVYENSIYEYYYALMAVPAGEQPSYIGNTFIANEDIRNIIRPAFIRVRLSQAQADALGDLRQESVRVSFEIQDYIDNNTEAKADFAAEVIALKEIIKEALADEDKEVSE